MTTEEYCVLRFDNAVRLLPYGMRERVRALGRQERCRCEEIRLRIGHPPTVLLPDGERSLGGDNVTRRDMDALMELATGASVHAVREQLRGGYITIKGGYRLGVCGSVTSSDGQVVGYTSFSSAALRISKEIIGAADGILDEISENGQVVSTLIVSPPGAGKTTLLRDLVRQVSDKQSMRVALADERSEVAAFSAGEAQMAVGKYTDVLDSCPKAKAVMMLLRAMNPQVIALDEITSPEDAASVTTAANCGVRLIATAHADSLSDLTEKALYRRLFDDKVFRRVVVINKSGALREYSVKRWDEVC